MGVVISRRHRLWCLKFTVGIMGCLVSIIAHELFHIALHHDRITHIDFFTNSAIVSMHVDIPSDYDLVGEEEAAYAISLLILFLTVIIVSKIHDRHDPRTTREMLFDQDDTIHHLESRAIFELAQRINLIE